MRERIVSPHAAPKASDPVRHAPNRNRVHPETADALPLNDSAATRDVRATEAQDSSELTPSGILALQRRAGNQAVAHAVRSIAQRVAIKEATKSETLYNTSSGGQATANKYSISPSYDMTRNGDTGATVTVRIKFLSQARNGVDPSAPGAPPGTPPLGALVGSPTEIPAGDERRAWATTVSADAAKIWNGRLTLVGEEWNAFSANTKKRLPVTFKSVAVFGLGDEADNTVIVHPRTTVAGSPGQPIDAGNWYLNKGTSYSGDDKVIAAHEYGHLLGIPDEYSQSNEQLNALLHQAAPAGAASAMAALDRASVERMVLVSLRQPLYNQLDAAMPTITNAIRLMRPLVKKKMAEAARTGTTAPEVRTALESQLIAASETTLSPSVPRVVAFETTRNFSNVSVADAGVESGFAAAALSKQIEDAYWQALLGASSGNVAVAGLGDVSIRVGGAVSATTVGTGANAAAASGVATSSVGPAAGGPGLPTVTPSASLAGQIQALPAAWSGVGSLLETGVTPAAFGAKMAAALAAAAAAAAAPPPGTAPAPKIERERALYQVAYTLVNNAARAAASQVAADLVSATVAPALAASVADLKSSVNAEVTRVMTTPPAGVAALGPADPNMAALVAAMKARLDADKAATAGTGRDPLGSGSSAPPQDVTYSYQGMMGSNATQAVRPDQFAAMVKQFNANLRTTFEKTFTAEVK